MEKKSAWGIGLATVTTTGRTLDVWYPDPRIGKYSKDEAAHTLELLSGLQSSDEARGTRTTIVTCIADLDDQPQSTADAYLRLHLLSHRLALPNSINLEGIISRMPKVVWTTVGPCPTDDFEATRIRLRAKYGFGISVTSVDRFPSMVNYVVPSGVSVADGSRVRLGAYLAKGTTVTHSAFISFNAGTLGESIVEGRISQGVVIGAGSEIGGGASARGSFAGWDAGRVSLGKRCLVGANAGLGIPLGDDCVVEAGLFLSAHTDVTLLPGGGVVPGNHGLFASPHIVKARDLAGASNVLFRRNSLSGRIEALSRSTGPITLADGSHSI